MTTPRADDPDEAIRERMTQVVILMQGSALALFTLPILIGWIAGAFPVEAPLIMFSLLAPTILGVLAGKSWKVANRWEPTSSPVFCSGAVF